MLGNRMDGSKGGESTKVGGGIMGNSELGIKVLSDRDPAGTEVSLDGAAVGRCVGKFVGDIEGSAVGKPEGDIVGRSVGESVGICEGLAEGTALGVLDGKEVGHCVGSRVGRLVRLSLAEAAPTDEGSGLMMILVGASVGLSDGCCDGSAEGWDVSGKTVETFSSETEEGGAVESLPKGKTASKR
jgi:hypothetical protein